MEGFGSQSVLIFSEGGLGGPRALLWETEAGVGAELPGQCQEPGAGGGVGLHHSPPLFGEGRSAALTAATRPAGCICTVRALDRRGRLRVHRARVQEVWGEVGEEGPAVQTGRLTARPGPAQAEGPLLGQPQGHWE